MASNSYGGKLLNLDIKKIVSDKEFTNGFRSWAETHFEIVSMITLDLERGGNNKVMELNETQGTGGLYSLAKQLTDKFEKLHEGREWDGEFFEEIEYFYAQELKKL